MILNRNMFIERVLPSSVLRQLTDQEMAEYRAPFVEKDSRQTMLNWPRQLPIAGEPENVVAWVRRYAHWLQQSAIPKLFINAEPGSILVGAQREFCRTWPNQKEVVVKGLHFIQEDSPDEIGRSVADWIGGASIMENASSEAPVYMIVNLMVHDAAEYRKYEKGFFPLLKRHGGAFVTFDDKPRTFEGAAPRQGRVIIFKFPSEERAARWYADPDYQALSAHRRAGTSLEFLTMVRGLPPRS